MLLNSTSTYNISGEFRKSSGGGGGGVGGGGGGGVDGGVGWWGVKVVSVLMPTTCWAGLLYVS